MDYEDDILAGDTCNFHVRDAHTDEEGPMLVLYCTVPITVQPPPSKAACGCAEAKESWRSSYDDFNAAIGEERRYAGSSPHHG